MAHYIKEPQVKPSQRAALQRAKVKQKKKRKVSARRAVQRANRKAFLEPTQPDAPRLSDFPLPPRNGDSFLGLALIFAGFILLTDYGSPNMRETIREALRSAVLGEHKPGETPFALFRPKDDGEEWGDTLPG